LMCDEMAPLRLPHHKYRMAPWPNKQKSTTRRPGFFWIYIPAVLITLMMNDDDVMVVAI
jgi:hypothetical protein